MVSEGISNADHCRGGNRPMDLEQLRVECRTWLAMARSPSLVDPLPLEIEDPLMLSSPASRANVRSLSRIFVIILALASSLSSFGGTPGSNREKTETGRPPSWIPPDAVQQIVLNIEGVWNGEEKDRLREISNLHPMVLNWWCRDFEHKLGVGPDELERIQGVEIPFRGFIIGITTTTKQGREELVTALAPAIEKKEHNGISYYEGRDQGIILVGEKAVVIVKSKGMREKILEQLAEGPMKQPAILDGDFQSPSLVWMIESPGFSSRLKDEEVKAPRWLKELTRATWHIGLYADDDLKLVLNARFDDMEAARSARGALKKSLVWLGSYLDMCETKMPAALERMSQEYPGANKLSPMMVNAIQAARKGITAATIQQVGSKVETIINIETDYPVSDAILLMSLSPRPPKQRPSN